MVTGRREITKATANFGPANLERHIPPPDVPVSARATGVHFGDADKPQGNIVGVDGDFAK